LDSLPRQKLTDQPGKDVAELPSGEGCNHGHWHAGKCGQAGAGVKQRRGVQQRGSCYETAAVKPVGLLISGEKFLLYSAFKIQHALHATALRHALEMTQAVLETAEVQPKQSGTAKAPVKIDVHRRKSTQKPGAPGKPLLTHRKILKELGAG
jgi:hypothetical protein